MFAVYREQQTPRINEAWLQEGWPMVISYYFAASPVLCFNRGCGRSSLSCLRT
jgi:hypothetical protein